MYLYATKEALNCILLQFSRFKIIREGVLIVVTVVAKSNYRYVKLIYLLVQLMMVTTSILLRIDPHGTIKMFCCKNPSNITILNTQYVIFICQKWKTWKCS